MANFLITEPSLSGGFYIVKKVYIGCSKAG